MLSRNRKQVGPPVSADLPIGRDRQQPFRSLSRALLVPVCLLFTWLLGGMTAPISAAEPWRAIDRELTIPVYQAPPNVAGRWQGRWTSQGNGHRGSLRVRLKPNGDGTYRGLFAGRFFIFLPYIYRAEVRQTGGALVSEKRLGPLGSYRMVLQNRGGSLQGYWTAAGEHGSIYLRRSRGLFRR